MSTVTNIIESMIRSYPTLYRSRLTALLTLFDSNAAAWVDGRLVPLEDYTSRAIAGEASSDYLPYPEAAGSTEGRERDRLFQLRENAKAQFTHDNASLIARDTMAGLDDHHFVRFEAARFDDMPSDVDPEWLEAAKELALGVVIHKPHASPRYGAEHSAAKAKEHAASSKICAQFLDRFQVTKPCPYTRAARVRELLREARALDLVLTESDGSAPKIKV